MSDSQGSFTLVAVGDLQLGDSSTCVGFGFASRWAAHGMGPVLAASAEALGGGDILFGNLECTLSSAGLEAGSWHSVQMRGIPGFATQLYQAGFRVLNVANNHAVQHGAESFRETVACLRAAGIAPCGVRGRDGWCTEPVVITTTAGVRVGILGYCHRPRQYGDETPPYAEGSRAEMLADLARLHPTVDHVVISLHWGEEFVALPSRPEVALAHGLIEAGAALIVGHHPHVLRPIVRYRNGVIAYSLGNFVADMVWHEPLRRGAVLRAKVGRTGAQTAESIRTRISDEFTPSALGAADPVEGEAPGAGLDEADYRAAIEATISAQRRAVYGYSLRNLHRFPAAMLAQLAAVTVRNKVAALRSLAGGGAK